MRSAVALCPVTASAAATQLASRGHAYFHWPYQAAATAPLGRVSSRRSASAAAASWRCQRVWPGTVPAARKRRCAGLSAAGPPPAGRPAGPASRPAGPLGTGSARIPSGDSRSAAIPFISSRGGGAAQPAVRTISSPASSRQAARRRRRARTPRPAGRSSVVPVAGVRQGLLAPDHLAGCGPARPPPLRELADDLESAAALVVLVRVPQPGQRG